jgi:hypothetical protein
LTTKIKANNRFLAKLGNLYGLTYEAIQNRFFKRYYLDILVYDEVEKFGDPGPKQKKDNIFER